MSVRGGGLGAHLRTIHALGMPAVSVPDGWQICRHRLDDVDDVLPGDVVACNWDIRERAALARLEALSARLPLVPVVCIDDGGEKAHHHLARSTLGPGWCHLVATDSLERFLAAEPAPGLGAHHFGVHWAGLRPAVADAVATMLDAPDLGPLLSQQAWRLGRSPEALGRAFRDDCRIGYAAMRERRGVALMLGRVVIGAGLKDAAETVGWQASNARLALRRQGLDWHCFAGADGRRRLREELPVVLRGREEGGS